MAASSDGYLFYRTAVGSDLTTQTALASGVTGAGSTILSARNSLSHLVIQRIRVVPTSYAAASFLTFTETDATGSGVAIIAQEVTGPATNAGEQGTFVDFGPKGWKMGVGKNLFLVRSSATGPGANVVVEAYGIVSTGPLALATTN